MKEWKCPLMSVACWVILVTHMTSFYDILWPFPCVHSNVRRPPETRTRSPPVTRPKTTWLLPVQFSSTRERLFTKLLVILIPFYTRLGVIKPLATDDQKYAKSLVIWTLFSSFFMHFEQVSTHQVNTVSTLSKAMGMQILQYNVHVGVGPMAKLGNASAIMISTPNGNRLVLIDRSFSWSINQSVSQSVNKTINQSIHPLIHQ